MSTEEGSITRVEGDKAWVRVRRSSMCETCSSQGVCSNLSGGEVMEAEAFNTAKASKGDWVRLNIPDKSILKISFVFYMIPVVFLIVGTYFGYKWGPALSMDPELGALILGLTTCGLSFLPVKLFAGRAQHNRNYMPEITRVLHPGT